MKRFRLSLCMLLVAICAYSQSAYLRPGLADNWAFGFSIGAASPIKGHSFFGNMRPSLGLNLDKHLTPAFALGVEGFTLFNSSRWPNSVYSHTAVDDMYLGAYGSLDFMGFKGSACDFRPVALGVQAGAGWGHNFRTGGVDDHNFFGTKVGLFFRYNFSPRFALTLSPSVIWNMSDARNSMASASYSASRAIFQLQAGVRYNFGLGFECPRLYDAAMYDTLNNQVNTLRAGLDDANSQNVNANNRIAELEAQVRKLQDEKPIIKEDIVDNGFKTVIDVFFLRGSALITADQMPNVERIASYLKSNRNSRVDIKGYASCEGNIDVNKQLAQRRAEAVKNELIRRYDIDASRISAMGAGIGDIFEERSWNRVSVCTLEIK